MTDQETRQSALDSYTEAQTALAAFEAEHKGLLIEHRYLASCAGVAETELKMWARKNGDTANEWWSVSVTHPMKRFYDVDGLLEAEPWLRGVKGVVVTTVDRDMVLALVKAKAVPAETAERFLIEQPMTPAVTIRPVAPAVAPKVEESGE